MYCLNLQYFNKINLYINPKNKNIYSINFKYDLNKNKIIVFRKNVINKKYLNFLFKYNRLNYYSFNNINNIFSKNFFNAISVFLENNMKYVFVSTNSKLVLPYYLNIFDKTEIYKNKEFVFYNKNYINYKNWLYFFKSFLNKYDIKIIFFLHYTEFSKFFKFYDKINLVKIAIISESPVNLNFDYFFFCDKKSKLFLTIFILNYFMSVFYNIINLKNFNNKYIFFRKLKKIVNNELLLVNN